MKAKITNTYKRPVIYQGVNLKPGESREVDLEDYPLSPFVTVERKGTNKSRVIEPVINNITEGE